MNNFSRETTPEARRQHEENLKLADKKWSELRAEEHYENAISVAQWYWTEGFLWGLKIARAENNVLQKSKNDDTAISCVAGDNTIEKLCSTVDRLRAELRFERAKSELNDDTSELHELYRQLRHFRATKTQQ